MDSGQTGGCELYRFCTWLYKWVHGCILYMGSRCMGSLNRQVPHVQDFTRVYKVQTAFLDDLHELFGALKLMTANSVQDV